MTRGSIQEVKGDTMLLNPPLLRRILSVPKWNPRIGQKRHPPHPYKFERSLLEHTWHRCLLKPGRRLVWSIQQTGSIYIVYMVLYLNIVLRSKVPPVLISTHTLHRFIIFLRLPSTPPTEVHIGVLSSHVLHHLRN